MASTTRGVALNSTLIGFLAVIALWRTGAVRDHRLTS